MQIVPSTFIALAALALIAMKGPQRGLWVFLALTPLGAAAAFNLPAVGGASIGLVQLAVVMVFTMICLTQGGPNRLVGTVRPGQPGFWVLLLLVYCVLSAIYAPAIFRGATDVFAIARSANAEGIISKPLRPTTGNITQLFLLTLSILGFFAFATVFRLRPDPSVVVRGMIVATCVHFALGWLDVLSHKIGMPVLLDPIRTANYAILDDHRLMGLKRMIGGFPEASAFGAYSMGLFAFWLQYWLARPDAPWARLMLLASLMVVLRSTSSGAYVTLAVFLTLFGGWAAIRHLRRQVSRQAVMIALAAFLMVWIAVLLILASYVLLPSFTAFLDRLIFDKLGTSSGIERMSWNAQAYRNFLDTALMGAGLGSVRASNWLMAALGSVGLIGTGLFLTVMYSVFRLPTTQADGPTRDLVSALKTACFALFLGELLTGATPVLGVFFFALLGLITGLVRGQSLMAQTLRPKVA